MKRDFPTREVREYLVFMSPKCESRVCSLNGEGVWVWVWLSLWYIKRRGGGASTMFPMLEGSELEGSDADS